MIPNVARLNKVSRMKAAYTRLPSPFHRSDQIAEFIIVIRDMRSELL